MRPNQMAVLMLLVAAAAAPGQTTLGAPRAAVPGVSSAPRVVAPAQTLPTASAAQTTRIVHEEPGLVAEDHPGSRN